MMVEEIGKLSQNKPTLQLGNILFCDFGIVTPYINHIISDTYIYNYIYKSYHLGFPKWGDPLIYDPSLIVTQNIGFPTYGEAKARKSTRAELKSWGIPSRHHGFNRWTKILNMMRNRLVVDNGG